MNQDNNQNTFEETPNVPLTIGLRVQKVEDDVHFYQGVEFKEYMNIPDKDDKLLMSIFSYYNNICLYQS